ncbi:hypothetical protein OG259_39925 [Streptomyces sp. NBC_00250]|uniref:hypothetical protein n=1 Tax=Streptomyces sp. NBC_00250 TaxID=2903641 RepID=UPI002E2923FF|nr:hypothetical protein [Streptomyces sp. NBC_00250]
MGSKKDTKKTSVDVQVDDAGRIVVSAPELSAQLRDARSALPARARTVVNNGCNLVVGCGSGGGPKK